MKSIYKLEKANYELTQCTLFYMVFKTLVSLLIYIILVPHTIKMLKKNQIYIMVGHGDLF